MKQNVQVKSLPIRHSTSQTKKERTILAQRKAPAVSLPYSNKSISSSSNLSKINFGNCTFIADPNFKENIEVELFNLEDIAMYYDVDISSNNSNKAATKIVQAMVKGTKYTVKQEQGFFLMG